MARISITRTIYKVSDFLSWQKNDSLVLSPSFQRRAVWPIAAKSFLIDTVVQGLPMPIIFLREQTSLDTLEPIREVVDGQQRLRTLISFISPKLLKDFDPGKDIFQVAVNHNKELAGRSFEDLPKEVRKAILAYEFSVHVLPSETEDREVLQIFARMNATGIKLNFQELRNARFFGNFKTCAYNLAYEQLGRWREWEVFSEAEIARMDEVEETSDLIITMLDGIRGKSQVKLDRFYEEREDSFPEMEEVKKRFRDTMDSIASTIGDKIKDTIFSKRPIFHTLFTFYYKIMYGAGTFAERQKQRSITPSVVSAALTFSDRVVNGLIEDEEVLKVLRGSTASTGSRSVRYTYLVNILIDSL